MTNFRAEVYGKYKSIADLARSLGWTRQKATNIVNRKTEPSLEDVYSLSIALERPFEEVAEFFLHLWSHKCDE